MKQKIALFDFDKTVIYKDSILILYDKTCKKVPGFRAGLYKKLIKHTLFKHPRKIKTAVKEEFLQMLNYYSEAELRAFATKDLMDYAFPEAIRTLHRLKEEGYFIMLVSASVEDYLKYLDEVLPLDHIIGTETDDNFRLTGKNNRHEEKVSNILAYLRENDMVIDYENSVSFSDSLSADRPMMELTGHRYLINNPISSEGYENLEWKRPEK